MEKEIIVPVKFEENVIKLVNDADCFETFCMSIKGCDCNCPFWFHDCCGDTYEAFRKELEK